MNKKDTYTLSNGVKIPIIGFGTWQTPSNETAKIAVQAAIDAGYRHIDCAKIYGNEEVVGQAIRECGVSREELFITNKLWNADRGYETTLKACQESLDSMGLEYFDLYLIHWPASFHNHENWTQINIDTWKAMIELYKMGKVKAIGVSNFLEHHLEPLMKMEVIPMVNQIEYHPGQMQDEIVKYCQDNGMLIEAYSPLGTGKMLNNETLLSIAKKYNKSVAQICLRWEIQNGILPLPKSVTPSRIAQNIDVFDFELLEEDMNTISGMEYFAGSGHHPDNMKQ